MRSRIRGLYGIADAGNGGDPQLLASQMLAGGCRLLQLRCKGWSEDDVARAVREVLPRVRSAGGLLIVNDWAEVAASTGADGVHVGQDDLAAERAREIVGPDRLVGVSHNTPAQLEGSLPWADYLAVGPVFQTHNLSVDKPVRGLEWVTRAAGFSDLPVVAIGGITAARIPSVRQAGADAWAVISAICSATDPEAATRLLGAA